MEYTLLVGVLLGIFLMVIRPGFGNIQQKLAQGLKTALFANQNGQGSNFYYYPMK